MLTWADARRAGEPSRAPARPIVDCAPPLLHERQAAASSRPRFLDALLEALRPRFLDALPAWQLLQRGREGAQLLRFSDGRERPGGRSQAERGRAGAEECL